MTPGFWLILIFFFWYILQMILLIQAVSEERELSPLGKLVVLPMLLFMWLMSGVERVYKAISEALFFKKPEGDPDQ